MHAPHCCSCKTYDLLHATGHVTAGLPRLDSYQHVADVLMLRQPAHPHPINQRQGLQLFEAMNNHRLINSSRISQPAEATL